MFPLIRTRRNRSKSFIRDLVAECSLTAKDLILPIFVTSGINIKEEISTMPGIFRLSIDNVELLAKEAQEYGIKAIALFPVIESELKTEYAEESYNLDSLVCKCVRHLKNSGISIGIICDVALDPYTSHGHDGILNDKKDDVDNDETIKILQKQALVLSKSGADILAPSDMMDGRIEAIRQYLEDNGYGYIPIISYAAKYASSFYSPFRDAIGSKKSLGNFDKKTYQMDFRNSKEAMREIDLDINEGADIIMIKPALPYLDIISKSSANYHVPIFAYQVSGEYAMIKYASLNNALDFNQAMIEALTAMKRAGASAIFTYAAIEIAKLLR